MSYVPCPAHQKQARRDYKPKLRHVESILSEQSVLMGLALLEPTIRSYSRSNAWLADLLAECCASPRTEAHQALNSHHYPVELFQAAIEAARPYMTAARIAELMRFAGELWTGRFKTCDELARGVIQALMSKYLSEPSGEEFMHRYTALQHLVDALGRPPKP